MIDVAYNNKIFAQIKQEILFSFEKNKMAEYLLCVKKIPLLRAIQKRAGGHI